MSDWKWYKCGVPEKKLFPLFVLIDCRMDENGAENIVEIIRHEWCFKILALIKLEGKSLAKSPSLIGKLCYVIYVYFMTSPRASDRVIAWN